MLIRLAFHVPSQWPLLLLPSDVSQQLAVDRETALLRFLPADERVPILALRRAEDRRRSIVGRLLLRRACCELTGTAWKDVLLRRDPDGRPFLVREGGAGTERCRAFDANASHHGDWVVVVAGKSMDGGRPRLGVDVMRTDEIPGGGSVEELLDSMEDLYSPSERAVIRSQSTPGERLDRFFRFWTLKESVIKAMGGGMPAFHLADLDFRPNPASGFWRDGYVGATDLADPIVDTSTGLSNAALNGEGTWNFELSYLDDRHCVAVAIAPGSGNFGVTGGLTSSQRFWSADAAWVLRGAVSFDD